MDAHAPNCSAAVRACDDALASLGLCLANMPPLLSKPRVALAITLANIGSDEDAPTDEDARAAVEGGKLELGEVA